MKPRVYKANGLWWAELPLRQSPDYRPTVGYGSHAKAFQHAWEHATVHLMGGVL